MNRNLYKIFFIVGIVLIIWACKDEEFPEISGKNKIELTISEDSTSYIFAQLNGLLNEKPKFEIEQYGFCWDTILNVTLDNESNSFSNLSNQTFQNNIGTLKPNKTYYVKGYIQNGDVIIYSNELSIHTKDARPIVTTSDITNITGISAKGGGESESFETLFPVTQRGVCWAKTNNPTIMDSLTIDSLGNRLFESQLNKLEVGTNYYVRAYAINSEGISYGEEKSFSTLDGIPEITTDSIKNITATSATFYGNIIENDGMEILEKGFCWNTSTNPTTANNSQIVTGNTLGGFNAGITGFDVNTTYYVKAYIKNESSTFYGNEISFTTEYGLPSGITTTEVTDITAISAVSGGSIIDDGGFPITSCGVCWNTTANPTISDNYTIDGSGTGSFNSNISGLIAATNYYVRSYATNINGTVYGTEYSFITEDGVATISTSNITNITPNSAISGGNITDDGGDIITERGICWDTNQNPTVSNEYISNGSGTGSFTVGLSGLNPSTTYYVRAYAINSVDITYGNQVSFTTESGIPSIITNEVINITATSGTSGGVIDDDGGYPVIVRGICWDTNNNPTLSDNKTEDGSGIGTFTSSLTNLSLNSAYYVRAYAININDTTYGNEVTFNTLDGLPTISTTSVTGITYDSAASGGYNINDGGFSIIEKGVCWSTNSNPTITDNRTMDGSGTGSYTSNLTELSYNTTYYVRAYATNTNGTSYGPQISFKTNTINVGDNYGGGIVFYIFQSGESGYVEGEIHGLIAAPSDMGVSEWGCSGTTIGGTLTSIGTGLSNTVAIVNNCSTADIAARQCNDLTIEEYSDWYLPSKDELYKLYINKTIVNIEYGSYWSSSEYTSTAAWRQEFEFGYQNYYGKNNAYRVRAIRSF